MIIIKDENFIIKAQGVKPDSRGRLNLPKSLVGEGIMFHVYSNRLGQIILDPQVAIPACEYWVFQNAETLASIKRGLAQAAIGQTSKIDVDSL